MDLESIQLECHQNAINFSLSEGCTNIDDCSTCADDGSGTFICSECSKGFETKDSGVSCSKIECSTTTHCEKCETAASTDCISCKPGYEQVGDSKKCTKIACSEETHCLECATAASTDCISCKPGYEQVGDSKECTKIDCLSTSHCETCPSSDSTKCYTCANNFYPGEKDQNGLVDCIESYVCTEHESDAEIGKTCCKLVSNCIACLSTLKAECADCNSGFTLTIAKQCKSDDAIICTDLISNCQTCVKGQDGLDTADCQICAENYGITNAGKCEECSNTQAVHPTTHEYVTKCTTGNGESDCKTCSNENPSVCGSCNGNSQLNQGQCVPSSSNECKIGEGATDCKTCDTKNPLNCGSCNPNSGLTDDGKCAACKANEAVHPTTNKCVTKCTTGSGASDCKECATENPSVCGSCNENSQLNQGQCKPSSTPTSNCSPYITNCAECDNDDNKYCIKCNEGYGTKLGTCVKCTAGITNGVCNEDCSPIPGCNSCKRENDKLYCLGCEEGYKHDTKELTCIKPSKDECIKDRGCLKCSETDPFECISCNTDEHWRVDHKRCECEEGYKEYNNKCYPVEDWVCKGAVANCEYCMGGICVSCNDKYGLENGACVLCDDGFFKESDEPCLADCKTIEHCQQCHRDNGKTLCSSCDSGWIPNADETSCVEDKGVEDCKVIGCKLCKNGDPNTCYQNNCDDDNHFTSSTYKPGTCICKTGYDFLNDQCIEPIAPLLPTQLPIDETNLAHKDSLNANGITTRSFEGEIDSDKFYGQNIPSNVDIVQIPDSIKNIGFNINEIRNDKQLEIESNPSTNVFISSTENSKLDLKVQPDNNNINFEGNGELSFKPSKASDNILIKQLKPAGEEGITLKSADSNLIIDTLDIFGTTKVNGQNEGDKKTKCKNLLLEGGSDFTPHHISFTDNIKIGLNSVLHLDSEDVDVSNSAFVIKYNRTQYSSKSIPILITKVLPNFEKTKITSDTISAGAFLEEENLSIAEFSDITDKTDDEIKKACEDLAKKFTSNSNSLFGQANCDKNSAGNFEVSSKKKQKDPGNDDDDDKGLSAGAIAGIVIACVVVVAAIIALLVYFLVIKKKNQSTTSTQGDSSIAI